MLLGLKSGVCKVGEAQQIAQVKCSCHLSILPAKKKVIYSCIPVSIMSLIKLHPQGNHQQVSARVLVGYVTTSLGRIYDLKGDILRKNNLFTACEHIFGFLKNEAF